MPKSCFRFLTALLFITFTAACGAQDGTNPPPSGGDPQTAKCTLACRPGAQSSCTKDDQAGCTNDCLALIAGLPTPCQQYLVEGMRIKHESCTCSGTTCTRCSQSAADPYSCTSEICGIAGCTPLRCDPVMETKCSGLEAIRKVSDSAAKPLCMS